MPGFEFEEKQALFDVTPVANQFILEYLPEAKGDDVRVYLYGLAQCYHPQDDMTVERMALDLGMDPEEVAAAFRRWERKGLVRRVSDQPPRYRYVSLTWRLVSGAEPAVDPAYVAFIERMDEVFGPERKLHTREYALAYEWVEELHLPADVVLRLLEHLVATRGRSASLQQLKPLALQMAEEKIATVEDAEAILSQDELLRDGARKVLRRMGKRRAPSEDELKLYRQWITEWGFDLDAILAACAETTSGDPSFKYLNGILERHHEAYGGAPTTGAQMDRRMRDEKDAVAPLKALLKVLNLPGVKVNEGTRAVYAEMRALYPDDIILMAGRECARHGLTFDDVMKTLLVWKRQGLATAEEIAASIRQVNEQNAFVQTLFDLWGVRGRPAPGDRAWVQKWLGEWGLSEEMVTACAAYAAGTNRPMPYLNRVLEVLRAQGVTTPDAAAAVRAAWKERRTPAASAPAGKVVGEQRYEQRAYTNTLDALDSMMARWQEENGDAK